jgi:hypothetical protein
VAGRQLFNPSVGVFASWFWALWPWESLAGLPIANYALSAFVVALWLVVAPSLLANSKRKRDWILLGFIAGAVVLLNPALAPLLLASSIWIRLVNLSIPRISISVAVFIVVLAPWTIRNYEALHRLVPVRDNFGMELFIGNHPGMSGEADFTKDFPTADPRQYSQLGEVHYMDLKQHEAVEFIREYPTQFTRRFFRRFVGFWTEPSFVPWVFISILSSIGVTMATFRTSSRDIGIFLLIVFSIVPATYYLTHFWPTYRLPIEPLILLAAASAIHQLFLSLWHRRDVNAEPIHKTDLKTG